MGCDIHLYVEHKRKGHDTWWGFGKRINPGRIYGMFAKLADVRNTFGITPLSEPRGLPEDIGSEAFEDYALYVTEEEGERFATKEKADKWVRTGCSKYMRDGKFVSNPDAHSESWCTVSEFENAINEVWKDRFNGHEVEYLAVLDLMKSFERNGHDVRAVFWFDN